MGAMDGVEVVKPVVDEALTGLTGFADTWRQTWDPHTSGITALEQGGRIFGTGPMAKEILAWYRPANESLNESGVQMPDYFGSLAAGCSSVIRQHESTDRQLATRQARDLAGVGPTTPSVRRGGRPPAAERAGR